MEKKQQIHFWYVIAAVLLMLFIQSLYLQSTKLTPIPYSRFETLLDQNKITRGRDNPESDPRHLEGGRARWAEGVCHDAGSAARTRRKPEQARRHL